MDKKAASGPFMSVQEAAAELGVSPSRFYRLLATKAVPSVRIGGRIVIPRGAWATWIQGRTAEALASVGR